MQEEFQKFINQRFTKPDNNKSIFHYTTEQGYSEICRSEYLRINSHLFLNEKTKTNNELKTATTLIREGLQAHSELKKYIYTYDKFISYGIIYYTLSFSNYRSSLLANKYGNICLEFNALQIYEFSKKERTTMFGNVIYELAKQRELIDKAFEVFDQLGSNENTMIDLFLCLSLITPLLKPYEHCTDTECRIIQAEIFAPPDALIPREDGKIYTPMVTKKLPLSLREIINVYKEPK